MAIQRCPDNKFILIIWSHFQFECEFYLRFTNWQSTLHITRRQLINEIHLSLRIACSVFKIIKIIELNAIFSAIFERSDNEQQNTFVSFQRYTHSVRLLVASFSFGIVKMTARKTDSCQCKITALIVIANRLQGRQMLSFIDKCDLLSDTKPITRSENNN